MKYLILSLFFLAGISAFSPEDATDMVLVKGGTFTMGSNDGQPDEKPLHAVSLNDYYVSKKEVTVAEWKIFCKSVSKAMPEKTAWPLEDNFPMVYVCWTDACEYCNWLSAKNKLTQCYKIVKTGTNYQISCNFQANGYRLLTEAEWEFAARGGTLSKGYIYSGSNDINQVAYYGYNSDNKPHPVGQLKPNELGIYDMSGNAWEYVWDFYDSKYYNSSPSESPSGPDKGIYRVLRGGCLIRNAAMCKVSSRYYGLWQNFHGNVNGFRMARNAEK